jgi:hypothetical protein
LKLNEGFSGFNQDKGAARDSTDNVGALILGYIMLFGLLGWTTICVSTDMVAHDKLPTHNLIIAALKGLPCFEVPLPGWPCCGTSKHGRAERVTIIQHIMTQA